MRDRLGLFLYLGLVVLITTIHDLGFLAAMLALAAVVAGRDVLRIARRAGLAMFLFSSVVIVSYSVAALVRGDFSAGFVALITLRVFLLAYLTFLLQLRINLFRAMGFSRTLLYTLTLAYGQVLTFRRLFADFRLALKSRSITPPRISILYRHGAATASFFLNKSLKDSTEITQAMASRGFFSD